MVQKNQPPSSVIGVPLLCIFKRCNSWKCSIHFLRGPWVRWQWSWNFHWHFLSNNVSIVEWIHSTYALHGYGFLSALKQSYLLTEGFLVLFNYRKNTPCGFCTSFLPTFFLLSILPSKLQKYSRSYVCWQAELFFQLKASQF